MDEKQAAAKRESDYRHHIKQEKEFAQKVVESLTIDSFSYEDTDMLVFIDDAGDILPNKTRNLFCMGSISIWGRDYKRVEHKWHRLKMELFGIQPTELFHATENLKQVDAAGRWKLEYFLAESNFNAVMGQAFLNGLYAMEIQPLMASTSPLGVIEDQLNQIYQPQKRKEHWIIERSGKQDWRMIQMGLSGEHYHRFPKGEQSRLSFVNKRKTVLCGLEIADLVMNLFYKLTPEYSDVIRAWKRSNENAPPYYLRLHQAALGIPFAPLFSPHRKSAFGLSFL